MVKFSADRSYIEVFIFLTILGGKWEGPGALMLCYSLLASLAAGVQLNFRAGSTFPASVVLYRLAGVNKVGLALCTGLAGATRLTRSDFTHL